MGLRPRLRIPLASLFTSFCVVVFFSFAVGCGNSSKSNTASSGSGSGGSGSPSGTGSGGSGSGSSASTFLYVSDENTSGNSAGIYAYSVGSDGSLTAVSGSPFAAAGAGSMVVNGSELYAANTGGAIVTYSMGSNGALTQTSSLNVAGDAPGGGGPTQVFTNGASGQMLYDYYINDSDNAFQNFSVDAGKLTFVSDTAAYLSAGALAFTANGQYGYTTGCYHGTPDMEAYEVASNGTLAVSWNPQASGGNPPQPVGAQIEYCPGGAAVSGNNYVVLAETPNNDMTPTGPTELYVYTIDSANGSLSTTQNASAGVASGVGSTVSTYAFDPTGAWLAVSGANGIAIFSFSNGVLAQTGTAPISDTPITQLAWDNNGHLFGLGTVYQSATKLYVFNVAKGVPTAAPGSPVTTLPATGSGSIAVSSGTQTAP